MIRNIFISIVSGQGNITHNEKVKVSFEKLQVGTLWVKWGSFSSKSTNSLLDGPNNLDGKSFNREQGFIKPSDEETWFRTKDTQ